MPPYSELLLAPKGLANCLAAGVFRDTTNATLSDHDRLNYFPANPLFTVNRIFDGQLHMSSGLVDMAALRRTPPIPVLSSAPPQTQPVCSWSPGGLRALTVAVYPDAWFALGRSADGQTAPPALANAVMKQDVQIATIWHNICGLIEPVWQYARQQNRPLMEWTGSNRISDWARYVTTKAAITGTGRSMRSMERRVRNWTGQSQQTIDFFAKVEDLYARSVKDPNVPLADIAVAADFSDQSHMGRAVKRTTGFSPGQLNQLIETDEAFWCYRLLGQRF